MHINAKMFIPNPYVIKVYHPDISAISADMTEFRRVLKNARISAGDTWGYSNPGGEHISLTQEEFNRKQFPTSPYVNVHTLSNYLFFSYWFFKDDQDALQFRLITGNTAKQVFIWPSSRTFTITEFIETIDSDYQSI